MNQSFQRLDASEAFLFATVTVIPVQAGDAPVLDVGD
jgi:hypothetical protein